MLISSVCFCQLNDNAKAKCKSYAKEKWGTDYVMAQYEYNKQVEAGNEFFVLYGKYDCGSYTNEQDIPEECMIIVEAFAEWSDEDTGYVQWDRVLYQTKKQMEAYNNLK